MSYKIVQTWEHNKHRLLAVPSTWEDNNILKYPRKNIAKYVKIGTSIPELDWKQIKCDVKRRELPSYETADYVLQEMVNHTDTEDDTTNTATCKQSKPELNLNIIADEIVNLHPKFEQNLRNPNTFQESSVTYNHDVILKQQNKNATTVGPAAEDLNCGLSYEYIIPMSGSETNVNVENLDAFITVQNTLLTNQTKILEQLNSIQNVQTTTIQKIASLSVQLDDTLMQINNYFQNGDLQVTPLSACKSSPSNTPFNIKPIETVQQLDQLELELSNSANRQQKKQLYSVIFAGGKGIDCAYTLADVLFSREFLCQCSWSGGSRGNNEAKIAWKAYKNVLSFFWEMVNSWDNKYTVSHNVDFFKSILKNAKKRNMAKKERASTSRKRTKTSKSQSVNDEMESDKEGTSVKTAKKAKIEKQQTEKYENNEESISKQNNIVRGVVEEGINEKGNEKKSAKTLDSMIEENDYTIDQDQETSNDNEIPGDVDSIIDEIENTEEEEEDHEREEDTSNDKESTVNSDGTFEDSDIAHSEFEEEQKNNNEKINCPNSSMKENKTTDSDNIEEKNEKNTLNKKEVEKNHVKRSAIDSNSKSKMAIFEGKDKTHKKTEVEKIDDNENIYYPNSTINQNETMDKKREKRIKEIDEDTLKEKNSINVKIAKKNDRLEENLNSIIGENEKKDNDKEKEKAHGTIKLDSNFTNKENENIVEKQKKEKKIDRGIHSKSKKYMENKKKKETITT